MLWLKQFEPGHEKTCLILYANNKGADQPVHPRSLISAFFYSLPRFYSLCSLMLASVTEQASLSLTWSETPEDMFFLMTRLISMYKRIL